MWTTEEKVELLVLTMEIFYIDILHSSTPAWVGLGI
jgi:hypothetical protein